MRPVGDFVGRKIVEGLANAVFSVYNGYSYVYAKLPTRTQYAVSAVKTGAFGFGCYYLSGVKSERMCFTFTPGTIWAIKAAYQSGKCLLSDCDVKVLTENLQCGLPIYIKGPLILVAAGCIVVATKNLYSTVVPRRAN